MCRYRYHIIKKNFWSSISKQFFWKFYTDYINRSFILCPFHRRWLQVADLRKKPVAIRRSQEKNRFEHFTCLSCGGADQRQKISGLTVLIMPPSRAHILLTGRRWFKNTDLKIIPCHADIARAIRKQMAWMKKHGGSLRGPDVIMENKTSSIAMLPGYKF
jgi:hypothetical protein